MPSDIETSILLRRWEGVNRALDPAILPPTYLRQAGNLVPSLAGRLQARFGDIDLLALGGGATDAKAIHRCYLGANRYLYAVVTIAGAQTVRVSVDDGAFVGVPGAPAFTTSATTYTIVQHRNDLYIGNGIDPFKRVAIGGSAVDLSALISVTDGSAAPTLVADTGSSILTGTYAYTWATYNHSTKQWVARAQGREVSTVGAGDRHISFPAPTGFTPGANDRYHLFVAPVNLPLEFAHDQTPEGVTTGSGGIAAPIVLRTITADGVPVPLRNTIRTGNRAIVHREAIWFTNDNNLYSTCVIPPGREQAIFDHGAFFPAQAVQPFPGTITGIGHAAGTSRDNPRAPVAVFTIDGAWLWYGNLYDDPTAELIHISDEAGCVSGGTVATTPLGLVYLATRSVYLIPAGGGAPIDIGWPIENDIRAIPRERRSAALGYYHKGFYKIEFSGPGALTNNVAFWLDLRRGIGAMPSWWGPHTTTGLSAFTRGLVDTIEDDRGYVVVGTTLRVIDQPTSGTDGGVARSIVLETHEIDGGAPFREAIFTRVLVSAIAPAAISLIPTIVADGRAVAELDPLVLDGTETILWTMDWTKDWGRLGFAKGEAISPDERLRGCTFSLMFSITTNLQFELRDVEARFIPLARAVASYDKKA